MNIFSRLRRFRRLKLIEWPNNMSHRPLVGLGYQSGVGLSLNGDFVRRFCYRPDTIEFNAPWCEKKRKIIQYSITKLFEGNNLSQNMADSGQQFCYIKVDNWCETQLLWADFRQISHFLGAWERNDHLTSQIASNIIHYEGSITSFKLEMLFKNRIASRSPTRKHALCAESEGRLPKPCVFGGNFCDADYAVS